MTRDIVKKLKPLFLSILMINSIVALKIAVSYTQNIKTQARTSTDTLADIANIKLTQLDSTSCTINWTAKPNANISLILTKEDKTQQTIRITPQTNFVYSYTLASLIPDKSYTFSLKTHSPDHSYSSQNYHFRTLKE